MLSLLPVYLLLLLVFSNRYLFGVFLKRVRGRRFDRQAPIFEPTVSVVIPLYNEGRGIYQTIRSLLGQDYPADKLKVIVVDDCSTDDSYAWAQRAAAESPRVTVLRNPTNMGKRRGINNAVRNTDSEIIVSVDSDVVVEEQAVRRLVARFVDPTIAAVGGRVNVANTNESWLTRMQTIKYYYGYEFLKNLERAFGSVMCLSGCLTAYRRRVLLELEPVLRDRSVCGIPIKYGEDRFLTRQIVKAGHRTTLTLDAVCWTLAPPDLDSYFNQQLRWRRSNFIDFMCGLSHAWKLHPIVTIHYLALFGMLLSYPFIIIDNLLAEAFWELASFHCSALAVLGAIYWADTRSTPRAQKVHPLWFMAMAVVMPVTYILFTPLALFTLDSSSWETRGKEAPADAGERAPAPATATATASTPPLVAASARSDA